MFDDALRDFKERLFGQLARWGFGRLSPTVLSLIGLGFGVATAVALAQQQVVVGLVLWFFNRLFDGLDGTVARLRGSQSDFGGYLDILIDFLVYAIIPIGLVVGRPSEAAYLALAFLLATFYVNAASWMYLSSILEKRATRTPHAAYTTVTMPAGLIGGAATILFYTLFMLFPAVLVPLFGLMGVLVVVTIVQRLLWAYRVLQDESGV